MARNKMAAIFIRCSEEEAQRIRQAVKAERRTLSSFVINAVMKRIERRDRMLGYQNTRTIESRFPHRLPELTKADTSRT
jgi:hypothetical protein